MRNFRHALCIGKFYPPHLGHLALMQRASELADVVTVIVMASSVESLPLASRVEWVAESIADRPNVVVVGVMDDVEVDYDSPELWSQHVAIMKQALARLPHDPVDLVVSGEKYGFELARRFEAAHELVDRNGDGRSGTRCRQSIDAHWNDLVIPARIGLARKIVVLGAESTGTTTLAFGLSRALGAPFVPEWGRVLSVAKLMKMRTSRPNAQMDDVEWSGDDFTEIAATQKRLIEEACQASPLIVADTDPLATSVWHHRYLGGFHGPSNVLADRRPASLYILTTPSGIPFHQDGFRSSEDARMEMTATFMEVLKKKQTPFIVVDGDRQHRLEAALSAVLQYAGTFEFSALNGASPSAIPTVQF